MTAFRISLLLMLILFSCSPKSETDPYNSQLTLDYIGRLTLDQLNALDSNATVLNNKIFAGTRQELVRGAAWVESSIRSLKNPESNRHDLPRTWKTSQGVYAGMPIDSVEAINGTPFYLQLRDDTLFLANWEDGKLAHAGIFVKFMVEAGTPAAFTSSRDIISKGLTARCVSVVYQVPEAFYANKYWLEPEMPCQGHAGDYPFLSFKKLTEADLEPYAAHDMRLMRNEIFARYGYIFKSDDLVKFFSSKPWYRPQNANVDAMLSELEKANIALMQQIETRNRNSPLAKLIRKLPFLQLPVDPAYSYSQLVAIDSVIGYPDETITRMKSAGLAALLPDTSRIFAVLWLGTPPEALEDPGQPFLRSSDGNPFAAVLNDLAVYVTTLDKNMNHIQTTVIVTYTSIDREEAMQSSCSVEESRTSVLKRDWSYRSEYKAVRSCPVADGGYVNINFDDQLVGKIEKDGTIN